MTDLEAHEGTGLLEKYTNGNSIAQDASGFLGTVLLLIQVVAAAVFFILFSYDSADDYTTQKYIIFRDIMVMLLLGFG
eukprot:CAMPEP_0197235474 /NCGR_PEP_ID=MMETSP1429-20130617/2888_1 /TAXON_ID=49237 /ORGANISM="Chaetoceros  sp., Strain UNC1202" /LENGTH=77 /DNA_ID=CAMNT_0042694065 /DNA_START=19 /DNA_END=249 /DNA_ORIENTATION=+